MFLFLFFSAALAGMVVAGSVPRVARQATNTISCTNVLTGTLTMVSNTESWPLAVVNYGPLQVGNWADPEWFTFESCTSSFMGYTSSPSIYYG
jgi:hypothetical protein